MAVRRSRVGDAFGKALREARLAASLTQEQLAATAGYGANFISLLETGDRQPTISSIISLERALGLGQGDLVKATYANLPAKDRRAAA
jgi:transcriptional regulator with XRE-family HTH domain